VFSTPSETGTSYFRIFEPLRALYKKYGDEANFVYTENIQPNHLKIGDMVVMHRCGNLHSHFLSASRMWPKTEIKPLVVHDVDDNEFNLPATHPMKQLWEASGKHKMSIHSLKHSALITTTTEKLKKTFNNYNNDVHVFRNMFDWDLPQWNFNKDDMRKEMLGDWYPTDDKIVIGWAGLTSHFQDIKRMQPIMKSIHDKYPNTVFVLAGMALKDSQVEVIEHEDGRKEFKEVPIEDESQLYKNKILNMFKDFDPDRLKLFDALPLEQYAKFYTLFDISLSYVEHNAFASCKSEIKVIESLHYGCIPVFSLYGGYKDFWSNPALPTSVKDKNFAVAVTAPGPWVKAISYWVENIEEGKQKAAALKEYSDSIYDINENIDDYFTFIMTRIEDHKEEQINLNAKYMDYDGKY
jgi:glycosyltransferase involved in cell wall biosynthesis